MRETVHALALDPDNVGAQSMLVELLLDVKGPAPAEAEAELAREVDRLRARGARLAMVGFTLMLLTFPLALWLGIQSWPAIGLLSGVTLLAIAFSFFASKSGAKGWHAHVLAALSACLIAATSSLAGPFVLVPALAAAVVMYFVVHVSPSERRVAILLITLGAVAPYAIEALGVLPPAYAFEPGRIVLFARAVDFPKLPLLVGLIYTSITFVALPAIFAGKMRDELMLMQRRSALQAWQLRQLFPTATTRR